MKEKLCYKLRYNGTERIFTCWELPLALLCQISTKRTKGKLHSFMALRQI